MFVLDTNILSSIGKEPDGLAAQRFRTIEKSELATSVVNTGEILFGLAKAGYPAELTERMGRLIAGLTVLDLVRPVDETYAAVRAELLRSGRSISPNDLFIAAQARLLGATVVSADKGFRWVPGLHVENWLQAGSDDF